MTSPRLPDRSVVATPWLGRSLLAVAIVLLLEHARPVLVPIAVAIVFTFVLAAPVRALRRHGLHAYAASAVVVSAALGAVVVIGMLVAAPAAAWSSRAPQIVRQLVDAVQGWSDALFPYSPPAPLSRAGGAALPPSETLGERLAGEGWTFTRLAIGETIAFAFSASAAVILLFFLLASESSLVAKIATALRHARGRAIFLGGLRQAERDIRLFISTMSIVNVVLGTCTGLALWAIGLPNPVLWGVTTAVLAFIPYLGPLLVTFLLLLAGSVTFGNGLAMLAPPAAFLVLHGIEANFLSPMIMGYRLSLRPVVVFVAVMLWAWLWGIAGAFLAVPFLLALRAACKRVARLRPVCAFLESD